MEEHWLREYPRMVLTVEQREAARIRRKRLADDLPAGLILGGGIKCQ